MRLLLTSDLHRDGKRFLGLLDEAPEHDALLISGDLLDIFSNTSFTEQKSGALRWKDTVLKSGKSFAWCSGNHDFFHSDRTPMSGASPLWMRESPSTSRFVADGESRLLTIGHEQLAVTTIPWPVNGGSIMIDGVQTDYSDHAKALLQKGRELQKEKNVPWIVLCHEPPEETPLCPSYFAPEAAMAKRMIEAAQPDFSLHGHIHEAPTAHGGSWIWQVGKTVCFNPGQSFQEDPLHYIFLKWRARGDWTAVWNGASRVLRAESRGGAL